MAKGNMYSAKASTSKAELVTTTGGKTKHEKCAVCGYKNHKTTDCRLKDKLKCEYCKKFYHTADECRKLKWDKKKASEAQNMKKGKTKIVALALAKDEKAKKVEVNIAKIEEEALNAIGEIMFLSIEESDGLIDYKDNNDVQMADDNDNIDRVYDWLANSGSMLHIMNRKDLYSKYKPTPSAKKNQGA